MHKSVTLDAMTCFGLTTIAIIRTIPRMVG